MIPLNQSFYVDFLHFDSMWLPIFCLQIIMILDTYLQKADAVIQITPPQKYSPSSEEGN